jgi:hypothetical protein
MAAAVTSAFLINTVIAAPVIDINNETDGMATLIEIAESSANQPL